MGYYPLDIYNNKPFQNPIPNKLQHRNKYRSHYRFSQQYSIYIQLFNDNEYRLLQRRHYREQKD